MRIQIGISVPKYDFWIPRVRRPIGFSKLSPDPNDKIDMAEDISVSTGPIAFLVCCGYADQNKTSVVSVRYQCSQRIAKVHVAQL